MRQKLLDRLQTWCFSKEDSRENTAILSCTGTGTITMAAFSSLTQPMLLGFTRFTRYLTQVSSRLPRTVCKDTAKPQPANASKYRSLKALKQNPNLLIWWLCLLFNFLFPLGWTNTSANQTLLKWHISLWKLLLPKITLLKHEEGGGEREHLWSNRCTEKGGVTKSFISYTFIQKDKFLVTLNSHLQNGVVWPNHKAVWWTSHTCSNTLHMGLL